MKTIFAIFLSLLTPPVGFSIVGEWKKGLVFFAIILSLGWVYSLGGSIGPVLFFITFTLTALVWAGGTFISVRHLLQSKSQIKLWRGIVVWLFSLAMLHACREYLYVGAPFLLTNNSMAPGIKFGQRFFVTKIGHPFRVGDRVVFQVEGNNFVGHLCGLYGDRISIVRGNVIRNGAESDCAVGLQREQELDIPETSINKNFVFIVNNGVFDSARVGPFPAEVIRGRISFVFDENMPAGVVVDSLFALFGKFQYFFRPF